MELMHYFGLIRKHWLSFATGAGVTVVIALVLILPQPDIFESKGTYVVRPTSVDDSDVVRAFDTLIRGAEINATFAAIARSDIIRDRAKAQVSIGPAIETSGLDVKAEVVTGTNIISILVRGQDPEAAAVYSEHIGQETIAYINELRDVFAIAQLDAPEVPSSPVGPNRRLNIAIALILSVGFGTTLAVAAEAWNRGSAQFPELNVMDTTTGLYNDQYFKLRVQHELGRARDSGRPLSLGMIRVATGDPWQSGRSLSDPEELRLVSSVVTDSLRAADVAAYLGDGTLAVIMPEIDIILAREIVVGWSDYSEPRFSRNGSSQFNVGSGACEYRSNWFIGDDQVLEVVDRVVGVNASVRPEFVPVSTK